MHLPVYYKAQSNAWMDAEIFILLFNHDFVLSVKEHLQKKGTPENSKTVLLLDNYRAHSPCQRTY
jgi:hypothetical protein